MTDAALQLSGALAGPLATLARTVSGWPRLEPALPARAVRFLTGWHSELARAARVAPTAELAATAFAVAHAIPALDDLAFALRRSRRLVAIKPGIEEALAALGRSMSARVRCVPPLVEPPREPLGPCIEVEVVPSSAREGTVVAVERRAILDGEALAVRGRVHVASGGGGGARLELLEAALVALEAAAPSREDMARLLREIDRCEADDPVANGEAAVRFAMNALERAGAVPEARRAAIAFLAGRGVQPIALEAGERFDAERHPPSAFERVLRPGRSGVVVETAQTGFRDAAGVVLNRAVVVVGE